MTEDRLRRIEDKLDNMTQALETLARLEERSITIFNANAVIQQDLKALGGKVTELEKQNVGKNYFFHTLDRVAVALLIGLALYFFKGS